MANPTILIVDDEPPNLALMRETLAASYTLAFARDGSEALNAIAKHRPALVLLDVDLPDANGFELCRKIKLMDETHAIKIIFVTGFSSPACTCRLRGTTGKLAIEPISGRRPTPVRGNRQCVHRDELVAHAAAKP